MYITESMTSCPWEKPESLPGLEFEALPDVNRRLPGSLWLALVSISHFFCFVFWVCLFVCIFLIFTFVFWKQTYLLRITPNMWFCISRFGQQHKTQSFLYYKALLFILQQPPTSCSHRDCTVYVKKQLLLAPSCSLPEGA